MLPYIFMVLRTYAPYVMFPVAVVIGTIGYNIESIMSDKSTPSQITSIEQERNNRMVQDIEKEKDPSKIDSLKDHSYTPKGVLTKNLSPSLKT